MRSGEIRIGLPTPTLHSHLEAGIVDAPGVQNLIPLYSGTKIQNQALMNLYHKIYGAGPPLIILHGLFGSGDNWRTVARMLEADYRCIIPDLRNHGRSPHDPVMNFEAMAADIIKLMDDLALDSASLLGHSMGGKVTMHLALSRPEKVERLIVADIAPKRYAPHHNEVIRAIQALRPEHVAGREEAESVLSTILEHDPTTVQFLMKSLSRRPQGGFAWKPDMPVIIQAYEQLIDEISAPRSYAGPVLFVRGEGSAYILDEDLPGIRALFPNIRLATIPGAGHWVHADAPEEFAREILHFMAENIG